MATRSDAFLVRVILAGVVIVLLAMGVRATFGLFMLTMGPVTGMGRDVFSMVFALQNLTWGVACIAMGILADRYGAGRTIALGALLYMLGLIGMRFATGPLGLYLTAGLLMGIGQGGTTFSVLLPVVARSVPASSRGRIMGIVSAGGSLGQFAVVSARQQLINNFNWYDALWALSIFHFLFSSYFVCGFHTASSPCTFLPM